MTKYSEYHWKFPNVLYIFRPDTPMKMIENYYFNYDFIYSFFIRSNELIVNQSIGSFVHNRIILFEGKESVL